jgi:hypothetical protein
MQKSSFLKKMLMSMLLDFDAYVSVLIRYQEKVCS